MKNRFKMLSNCLLFCFMGLVVNAQSLRNEETINDGWRFLNQGIAFGQNVSLVDDASWEKVNVPHTWNANDPFDTQKSYKRGIAWYRKTIKIDKDSREAKKFYLHFEGVNQVADVFVNGIFVGRHKGGYTAFTFDITKALNNEERQLIAVMVNNAHDAFIPPLSVGYALYGGIYRDVWLIETHAVHFDMENYGSKGVFIGTPEVSSKSAKVTVKGTVENEETSVQNIEVHSILYDASQKEIGRFDSNLTINSGEKATYNHEILVENPKLWSPDSPYLYTVKSSISKNGKTIDNIENPLGLRWFSFEANTGFSLNGKHLKLRGTNRHQDKKGQGSALSNEEHRRDMELIKDMGCNFIRLAHYPQDPEILKAADELGLLVWEEVPLVNYMTIDVEFLANAKHMLKEMIRQHYNHPSVVIWGSMNEIFLWGNNEDRINKQIDSTYMKNVARYAKELNNLIKAEDPSRYTTLAMHMSDDYDKVGIEDLPQIASYNIYSGWYGGVFEDFGKTLDRKHAKKPYQNIFISEYGAGSDIRLNSAQPKRFDFTGQYQRMFYESYLKQIKEREFISGSAIWNQFDFSQPHVGGSIPHLNQKGMATWDRQPKDVYYLYKANWNDEPMIYIAEKDWTKRASIKPKETYEITIYSNINQIELFINEKRIGRKHPNDINKTTWEVSLNAGQNNLRAIGKSNGKVIEDFTTIEVLNFAESNRSQLAINVGSNAQYTDKSGDVWINDDKFNGIYGYTNGKPSLVNRKYIIRGSEHDPMYYTYLDDVKEYKVKVANGTYKVTMFFIENEMLLPNERVFDVLINGHKMIHDLDIMKEAGFCYGLQKTIEVDVKDNKISMDFNPIQGKAILSGLKIYKVK